MGNQKMEVRSHGQYSLGAASNRKNLMPLLLCVLVKRELPATGHGAM